MGCGKGTTVTEIGRLLVTRELVPPMPASPAERAIAEWGAMADTSRLEKSLSDAVAGNKAISNSMKGEFAPALSKLLTASPNPIGLLGNKNPFGKGATNLSQNVTNEGTGYGSAYEVIGTALLMEAGRSISGSNKQLSIAPGEQVSFGIRVPAGPGRRTVEADAYIHKATGPVGIDFKFRSNGSYSGSKALAKQLEGVKEAIRVGSLREFHFATNGRVSHSSKMLIKKADADIRAEIRAAQQRHQRDPARSTVAQLGLLSVNANSSVSGFVEVL